MYLICKTVEVIIKELSTQIMSFSVNWEKNPDFQLLTNINIFLGSTSLISYFLTSLNLYKTYNFRLVIEVGHDIYSTLFPKTHYHR